MPAPISNKHAMDIYIYPYNKRVILISAFFQGYTQLYPNASIQLDIDGFHVNTEELPFPYGNYICSTSRGQIQGSEPVHARYEIVNEISMYFFLNFF